MNWRGKLNIGELTVDTIVGGAGIGFPTPGTIYYLDPANGNDTNDGKSPAKAVKSWATAYGKLTANKNDVLVYIGGSTSLRTTAAVTWNKSYTHFIGISAPVMAGNRARIFATSTQTDAVWWTVSASGCIFKNIRWHYGVASASALGCMKVTGGRNYFENCSIEGIGNNTQDAANAYSLELNGAGENVFKHCSIGLDTIARGTASNDEIRCDASAVRNIFEDCIIFAYIEADSHNLVKVVDNTGLDRYLIFRNCLFLSESSNNGTDMTSAFDVPANMVTSYIIIDNCTKVGITDWESNDRGKTYTSGSYAGTAGTGCGSVQNF